MTDKIKSWWSENGKWFCILVNDGVSQATVSLDPYEAHKFAQEIVAQDPLAVNEEERGTG